MMYGPRANLQGQPDAFGEARRRFYEIYSLVRRSLPSDATHDDICTVLTTLATSTYADAAKDCIVMEEMWGGREPDEKYGKRART